MSRLAHSPPTPDRSPDLYHDHVSGTVARAMSAAEGIRPHVRDAARGERLLRAVQDGATFHDLGKLDAETQAALGRGRKQRLTWDHVDAGVAHLMSRGAGSAAWIVRAHHAPGLPKYLNHFSVASGGRRLRGRRDDERSREEHEAQIARTDASLEDLLGGHTADVGASEPSRAKTDHGLFLRLALSCLVDGDHSASAHYETGWTPPEPVPPRWHERLEHLDAYVARLATKSEPRQADRSAFYRACRTRSTDEAMVACEGPVGIGKTTAVMAWLLRRAIATGARRIVVVAPYTAILTQTAEVLREALRLDHECETADRVVAEHHHRADFQSLSSRDLATLWQAPIVLTTALQFFETLAACEPGRLRKFHALPGSAVFLDEAHATLPAPLLRQNWIWMRELAADWNCSFAFASGSLARFWENADVVGTDNTADLADLAEKSLVGQFRKSETRRIRFRTMGRIDGGLAGLAAAIMAAPGPRLIIFNTVQSAAVMTKFFVESKICEVHHLSTALCPDDRSESLVAVTARLCPKLPSDWCLFATSLVEAGVDLSFRTAFRERFSVASLIQVGGRVNRHGTDPVPGEVVDFTFDRGDLLTTHRGARESAASVAKLFADDLLSGEIDPAVLVGNALSLEAARDAGSLGERLRKAEGARDYPEVAQLSRVIATDTRLVVVKSHLRDRLESGDKVDSRTLLGGSVQIWRKRFDDLQLLPIRRCADITWWPYLYDSALLGYMKGALQFLPGEAFLR